MTNTTQTPDTSSKSANKDATGEAKGSENSNLNTEETNATYGPLQKTAGLAGNDNFMRQNTKNYDAFKYFLEGIDATDQNLDQMTPYIPGISRLYFHKVPYFMQTAFPNLTDNFRSYIETGFKAISGIGDLSATEATIEGGWANQKLDNISTVTDDTTQIEVTLYEQTGSPVRQFIETWMTGIRDPRSGVAHYHGVVTSPVSGRGGDVDYGEQNHTGEFVYVVLDPTAQYIEYAALLAHVWPKNVPKQHLNYTSGDRGPAEMQLQFSCIKYEGKYINEIAAYYISKSNLVYNYLDFNPYRPNVDAHASWDETNGVTASNSDFERYMTSERTEHAGTEKLATGS